MKSSTLIALLALASFTFTGCMPHTTGDLDDEEKATLEHALNAQQADTSNSGSLWANGGAGLLSDPKAARLGDLVTVLVQETAKATRSLGSNQSKSSSRDAGLSGNLSFSGNQRTSGVTSSGNVGMTNSKSFNGSGSTNNSDTLTASVTSVVTKVYPNGNLYIVGKRKLTINHEPQEITFSGIIRPIDILPDNSISSAKVAQARISYGGAGALATVAHEGWFSQTLDQIWPF